MAHLGMMNRLGIRRVTDNGALLDGGASGDILLPKRDVPARAQPGDKIEVFVYQDAEDRPRATTRKPLAEAGRFAALRVVSTTASGAYLDWGLPTDLFVPRSEQQDNMAQGESYVVFIFLDKKNHRPIASSKLEKFFSLRPLSYEEGEEVDLLVYARTDLGYKAVVNQAHGGILYKNEVFQQLTIGRQLKGYIKKIRDDRKIDLSLQRAGYQGVDAVSRTILNALKKQGGRMAVTDKSPPAEIYSRFGVSKKTFKMAIGSLYKKRLISIDANGISLTGEG